MHQLNELTTPSLVTKEEILPTITAHQNYWQVATSNNTHRAYQSNVRHFISSGGLLPATIESLLYYLNNQAKLVNPRILKRRLIATKQWHVTQTFPDPTLHPPIKKTLRGIARTHGRPADKVAVLSVEQLIIGSLWIPGSYATSS